MTEARTKIDRYLEAALELAKEAIDSEQEAESVVVTGESSLLNQASPEDIQKLRELFDAFERKRDLLDLMERCSRADGIQIFIGEEAGFDVFGDFSAYGPCWCSVTRGTGGHRSYSHGIRKGDSHC